MAALLREMSGLNGKTMFECVESSFCFQQMLATGERGSSWPLRFWLTRKKNRMGILSDIEGEWAHQICNFYVGRHLLDHVTLKKMWDGCCET